MRRSSCGDETNQGDFETFYDTHYARVRQYVARRVEAHDVDDVLVETFTVAARRFDELPSTLSSQTGWLLVTARYRIGNLRRSIRRNRALSDRLRALAPRQPSVAEPILPGDGFADSEIQRAFEQLSDTDQTVLKMVAWDACTPDELAAILDCSVGAAKTRLSRAKARFKTAAESG